MASDRSLFAVVFVFFFLLYFWVPQRKADLGFTYVHWLFIWQQTCKENKEKQGKYDINTTTNSAAAAAQNHLQSAIVVLLTMQFSCYNFIFRQQIQSRVPFRAGESLLSWIAQNMHHITHCMMLTQHWFSRLNFYARVCVCVCPHIRVCMHRCVTKHWRISLSFGCISLTSRQEHPYW